MNAKRKPAINNKLLEVLDQIVEGRAEEALKWLDQVANGVKNDTGGMLTRPDPKLAFELWQSMLEYRVPKLARTEVTGSLRVDRADELTDDQLADIARGRRHRTAEKTGGEEVAGPVH